MASAPRALPPSGPCAHPPAPAPGSAADSAASPPASASAVARPSSTASAEAVWDSSCARPLAEAAAGPPAAAAREPQPATGSAGARRFACSAPHTWPGVLRSAADCRALTRASPAAARAEWPPASHAPAPRTTPHSSQAAGPPNTVTMHRVLQRPMPLARAAHCRALWGGGCASARPRLCPRPLAWCGRRRLRRCSRLACSMLTDVSCAVYLGAWPASGAATPGHCRKWGHRKRAPGGPSPPCAPAPAAPPGSTWRAAR
jgi:hypothetical protein